MSYKKTNQIIEELSNNLFIVEGEITDLLTSETMQNLNFQMQNTTGAIAIGSALAGQIGNAALASFFASDEGIEVSDFAVEITDQNNKKHYFTGCFPVVMFKKGDAIKVVAEPDNEKYARAVAVIDQKNHYIWTGQQVIKGRMKYRISTMKGGVFFGFFGVMTLVIFALFDGEAGINFIRKAYVLITLFACLLICLFAGWRIGGSFDEQSIEFESILKKLGFNKPTMASLNNYSVFAINRKNKIKMDDYPDRWEQYTYHLDLVKKADEEKYGKK